MTSRVNHLRQLSGSRGLASIRMCPSEATNTLGVSKPIYLFSTSSHSKAISVNSLDIKLLKPDIDFSKYDYFIITSKQSSEALQQYDNLDLKPSLCISKQTALSYKSIGGEVLDIGSGYGDSLAKKITKYPKRTKWLYLRAKVVASESITLLNNDGYSIDEAIMYETKCSKEIKDIKIKDRATLIFTSPSSIKCFLQYHEISLNFKVIVIGNTTAKALPKNVNYQVSAEKTIDSCLDLV